ncbi:MAG TPA: LysM peptidoglycan-binding domain-containing protein [Candidatus Aminicenantes bacterium]|nr:LysM peptidoglycan-binding domain-containing protein [Candidatus Aminicenantes bacterium]
MREKRVFSWAAALASLAFLLPAACSTAPKPPRTAPEAPPRTAPAAAGQAEAVKPPEVPGPEALAPPAGAGLKPAEPGEAEGKPGAGKDAASLLEDAFAAYEEAQAALEREDMDGALARLDEAYSLLLKISAPTDSPILQEKSDLRILIAQRIQKISAFRTTLASPVNGSIPLVENQWVLREVKSFQTVERKAFEEAYRRSGQYMDMILAELRSARLPEQLAWIPLIESAFKPRALSRARALGMWQFIRSTGYRYGLEQDKYVDERMDPVKATRAAIRYMVELHDMFGDWTTAIAAYNCGEAAVQRVIRAQKVDYFDSFWDIFANLPFETARHVPRFIATLLIVGDPAKYGFELAAPDPPLAFETVKVNAAVRLATLSQSLGLDAAVLVGLNPELRHDSTPNYAYDLRVPAGYGDPCLASIASLPQYIPPDVVTDRLTVRPGDTLGAIARRYRTSVDALKRLNGLGSNLIRVGQVLRVPSRGGVEAASAAPAAKPGEAVTHVVRNGDNLFQIAKLYGTTVERIKASNGLVSDIIAVGQKLVIQAGPDK